MSQCNCTGQCHQGNCGVGYLPQAPGNAVPFVTGMTADNRPTRQEFDELKQRVLELEGRAFRQAQPNWYWNPYYLYTQPQLPWWTYTTNEIVINDGHQIQCEGTGL